MIISVAHIQEICGDLDFNICFCHKDPSKIAFCTWLVSAYFLFVLQSL